MSKITAHRSSSLNNGMLLWLKWSKELSEPQNAIKQVIKSKLGNPVFDFKQHQLYVVDQGIPFNTIEDDLKNLNQNQRAFCAFPHGFNSAGNAKIQLHRFGKLSRRKFKFSSSSTGIVLMVSWSKLGKNPDALHPQRVYDFRQKMNNLVTQRQVSHIYSRDRVSMYKIGRSITFEKIKSYLDEFVKKSDQAIAIFPHGTKGSNATMSIMLYGRLRNALDPVKE